MLAETAAGATPQQGSTWAVCLSRAGGGLYKGSASHSSGGITCRGVDSGVRRFCANCDTQAMMTVEPLRGRRLAGSEMHPRASTRLPCRLGQYRRGKAGRRVAVSMGGARGATMAAGYAGSETLHQIPLGGGCHWCAAQPLCFLLPTW